MTPIEDTIGPDDLAELGAELPRRRWSGKRIVASTALVLGLAAGVYAVAEYSRPAAVAPVSTPLNPQP